MTYEIIEARTNHDKKRKRKKEFKIFFPIRLVYFYLPLFNLLL